jgi:hypothetical protein
VVDDAPVLLFSYGTLQQRDVQLGSFGRELAGTPDALPGFRVVLIPITDPAVVALSGSAEHPLVVPSDEPADEVSGTVFAISPEELLAADDYEVDDYARQLLPLRSGRSAWVYLAAPLP